MKDKSESLVKQELAALTKTGKGVLRPEAVVAFARNPDTALHGRFEWDNAKASHQYRLHQARNLIRVVVLYEPRVDKNIDVYVSLPEDRLNPGGGYRRMVDVLSDTDRRQQLLDSALAELAVFQQKYATITELADVFSAARKVIARAKQRKRKLVTKPAASVARASR